MKQPQPSGKPIPAAQKAVEFYDSNANHIEFMQGIDSIGFDWDNCKSQCFTGKNYSKTEFKRIVNNFFKTRR